jgi:hypothetical protein
VGGGEEGGKREGSKEGVGEAGLSPAVALPCVGAGATGHWALAASASTCCLSHGRAVLSPTALWLNRRMCPADWHLLSISPLLIAVPVRMKLASGVTLQFACSNGRPRRRDASRRARCAGRLAWLSDKQLAEGGNCALS